MGRLRCVSALAEQGGAADVALMVSAIRTGQVDVSGVIGFAGGAPVVSPHTEELFIPAAGVKHDPASRGCS